MNEVIRNLTDSLIHNKVPTNFEGTLSDVEGALREEMRKLVGNYNLYRRNKLELFELIQSNIDAVLPNRIIDIFGMFAEVQHFAQGSKPVFKRRLGKARAKQFVTKVGPAGTYETFRLDSTDFTVDTQAYGGAVAIDFERYLDGLEDLMELYDIVVETLSDIIFGLVQDALLASWDATGRPAANLKYSNAFDAAKMVELCNTISAYGTPIIIALRSSLLR